MDARQEERGGESEPKTLEARADRKATPDMRQHAARSIVQRRAPSPDLQDAAALDLGNLRGLSSPGNGAGQVGLLFLEESREDERLVGLSGRPRSAIDLVIVPPLACILDGGTAVRPNEPGERIVARWSAQAGASLDHRRRGAKVHRVQDVKHATPARGSPSSTRVRVPPDPTKPLARLPGGGTHASRQPSPRGVGRRSIQQAADGHI
jgi:hypothetical protein